MDLTVVLPVYNEKELVIPLYRALRSSLDRLVKDYDIIFVDDFRIDPDRQHLLGAVDGDGHHAAAGVAFDAQLVHLFLQALLHLLRLFQHLLHVRHRHV